MESVIDRFLKAGHYTPSKEGFRCNGHGYDYGGGYGFGRLGSGTGNIGIYNSDGSGMGSGEGFHKMSGYGRGNGNKSGYDIIEFNHQKVYYIDGMETLIDVVHGNYALGRILNKNLTLKKCYIARVGNSFAHGKTLSEAVSDAESKETQRKPLIKRLDEFIVQYPTLDSVAEHSDLYKWHGILTGSCQFGRDEFAKEHDLDKDNGSMTVRRFIKLTINQYGGEVIKQLKGWYDK